MADKNFYIAKTNFTGGQWSPELAGRVDLPQFPNAVRVMQNYVPVPRGGVQVRSGTVYVAHAKFNDKATRLTGFEFNTEQTYMLEFGDSYIRFFANNSRLEEAAKTITDVADNGGAVVVTSVAHGYLNGDPVAIRGVFGVPDANGDFIVANKTDDTFELGGLAFSGEYAGGGTARKIIEITSPYIEEDVFQLKFTQSADVMYVFSPYYPTYKLARTGAATFTLTEVDWEITPFLPINITNTTLDPDTNIAVGLFNVVVANTAIFLPEHVGTHFRIKTGVVKVTEVTSDTEVNSIVKKALPDATATKDWSEGAWGDNTSGFPGAGVFYENRLVVGGSLRESQTVWGSKSGQYENFDMSNTAENFGFQYELASRKANIIRWMVGDDLLLIGTSGREFKMTGGNDSGITPVNVLARPQSSHGSLDIESAETTSGVVFVQRTGTKARLMSYSIDQDRYVASDLTLTSNRILNPGVVQSSYAAEPNEVVWFTLSDGAFVSLTLLSSQNVVGWAKHNTLGEYKSNATITTPTHDQTWVVVSRLVGGVQRQYIEYLDPTIALDSAVKQTFEDPIVGIEIGLEHLNGLTVRILGDGAAYPEQTVQAGALPDEFAPSLNEIVVGIPFVPSMEFFKPDRELPEGHTTSRNTKVIQVALMVDESLGFTVNGEMNPVRSTSDLMDIPVQPETEILYFTPDLDWNEPVVVTQHLSLPGQILAAFMYVEIGE